MGAGPAPDPGLRRPRVAISAFFALDGFPDVKEQTAASSSALGLALLGVSAGVLLALSVALPPHTHSVAALGGVLLGSWAPSVWAALVGFAVTGPGLANIFPVAIGQAGAVAGPRGVAAASTLGYGGLLAGPVAIGFLAEWLSLAAALSADAAVIAYATRRAVREPA